MDMKFYSPISKKLFAAAIALGTVLGAAGVANALTAQDDPTPAPTTDTTLVQPAVQDDDSTGIDSESQPEGADDDAAEVGQVDDGDDGDHEHDGDRANNEVALTGSDADQASTAALGAVPGGTIDRLETDDQGAAYEAHMTDADGMRVTVKLDESFAVISVDSDGEGRGHGEGRGPGGHDETPLIGDVADQVTAAALAAVPGGTVTKVEQDGTGFEAHVTDTDGSEVEVHFDANMAVLEIEAGH
jgi:uncharacterized membrane protein YkoI